MLLHSIEDTNSADHGPTEPLLPGDKIPFKVKGYEPLVPEDKSTSR